MFDLILRFLSLHPTVGALVYSWGSFEIGRMYFRMGREKGALLWGGLGVLAAVIYFFVAIFFVQWFGIILLGATVWFEVWFMKQWFRPDSQPTQPPN